MGNLTLFIISVIITEAVTEILSKSTLFLPIRKWLFDRKSNKVCNFIHQLIDCPFCTSVWVGTTVGLITLNINIVNSYIDWFIVGLLLHKSANITHNLIDRTRHNNNH